MFLCHLPIIVICKILVCFIVEWTGIPTTLLIIKASPLPKELISQPGPSSSFSQLLAIPGTHEQQATG